MPERIRGSVSRRSRLQFRGPPHKRAPGEESVLLRNVCQRIALGPRCPRCHRVPKKPSLIDKPHSPRLPLPGSKPFARLNGFGPVMLYANWRNVKKKKKNSKKAMLLNIRPKVSGLPPKTLSRQKVLMYMTCHLVPGARAVH